MSTTDTPRCGHMTSTGPCHRPEGHANNGHKSETNLKRKPKAPRTVADIEAQIAALKVELAEAKKAEKAQEQAELEALAALAAKLGKKVEDA
jgi:hypothetical protein